MLSPQHITKGAAVALAVGAFAAPVASAGPVGVYSRQDKQVTPSTQPQPVTAGPIASYSRQDKQLTPSSQPAPVPTSRPVTISPRPVLPPWATAGSAAFLAGTSHASQTAARATAPGGGFDWGDAGIGAAGGLVLSIVAIGGGLVLVQRRPRTDKAAAVATG